MTDLPTSNNQKKIRMNILKVMIIVGALVCASTSHASVSRAGPVNVRIDSEGQALAKGYARAFDRLPAGAKYVVIKTEDGPRYIDGSVQSLEALEAVLLIQIVNGPIHIINAHDIAKVTNQK